MFLCLGSGPSPSGFYQGFYVRQKEKENIYYASLKEKERVSRWILCLKVIFKGDETFADGPKVTKTFTCKSDRVHFLRFTIAEGILMFTRTFIFNSIVDRLQWHFYRKIDVCKVSFDNQKNVTYVKYDHVR